MTVTKSVITKIEWTPENPGWVIYFNDNTHFLRVKAKYKIDPKVGDRITLYDFPNTRGLEINDKVVFMHDQETVSNFYTMLNDSVSHCKQVETIFQNMGDRR